MALAFEEMNVGTTEEPRPLSIAKDLPPSEKMTLIELLREYKDVFAWSHKDMKGLDLKFYQHQIDLLTDVKLVQQHRYRMSPNYADKLLKIGFIRPVKKATWLSSIIVVPKKNEKIYICIGYRKLNVVIVTNAYPLPFTDGVLDAVAGH